MGKEVAYRIRETIVVDISLNFNILFGIPSAS